MAKNGAGMCPVQAGTSDWDIKQGDASELLSEVEDGSCKLLITSPPYNIGKEYERDQRLPLSEHVDWLDAIIEKAVAKIDDQGHICWQVGNFVSDGEVFPLDVFFYDSFKSRGFKLRNRIIWHFNFGLHASTRFSGRYETLLWFTKGDDYTFNLDPVRVGQLYPGKRHSSRKGSKAGTPSGNPKGKNPSDFWVFNPEKELRESGVWDFPNVKANHPEKTAHPCQFPSELVERCVLALTNKHDIVLDPFIGSGTTAIAALKYQRRVIGIDRDSAYVEQARERVRNRETAKTRPMGKPIRRPKEGEKVASLPIEWGHLNGGQDGRGEEEKKAANS